MRTIWEQVLMEMTVWLASDDMPAGTVVVGREAKEAEGGMAPRRSTEKERIKKKKKNKSVNDSGS